MSLFFFFFQAEDGIRDLTVTGVQTCALPIWGMRRAPHRSRRCSRPARLLRGLSSTPRRTSRCCRTRSEEHTSELQSQSNLVCRLLLEKKKKKAQRRLARAAGSSNKHVDLAKH